jgi:hypothetical protein
VRDGKLLQRGAMWILATGVAGIAAVTSYSHIYDLGRLHGGSGAPGRLLPFSVDMLIVVGELMLLHETDKQGNRFWLGWVLVSSGIAATMAANLAYGARYGITGALIWGWPAYSFVLVAAGMISVMKRAARRQGSALPGAVPSPVPSDAENAALMALEATLAAGNPLSGRQLETRFGLTRAEATRVRQSVFASANGQHPEDPGEAAPDN